MKRRLLAAVLALGIASSALAGCGSGGSTSDSGKADSSSSASSVSASTDVASAAVADEESGEPQYGGTLRYGTLESPFGGFTPTNTSNGSLQYMTIAYESLLTYTESGELEGLLATDWETNPDEPSITFHLREGVEFCDGAPFNAEAVKKNIETYKEYERTEVSNVASVDVVDDYTIKLNLDKWSSSALESVGFFVYYMSPEKIDPDGLAQSSCGTGPFQISEFKPGVSVTYTKNENYWQDGKPYLDAVEIVCVSEATTLASAFEAGEYDIVHFKDLTVASDTEAKGSTQFGNIVRETNKSGQGLVTTGLIPNSAKEGPFQDWRVRLAMAEAIDTESLIAAFGYGLLTTTDQWASPNAITYNKEMNAMHYDVEHAKQLMADAGYESGFTTTLYMVPDNRDMFTAIAGMLEEIGIHCDIEMVDNSAENEMFATGNWDGLLAHYASIAPDLGLYMGRHLDYNGAFYAKGIEHPDEAMELLDEIRYAKTDEEKLELEYAMQDLMYDHEEGLALFGRPLYIQTEPILKYDYVHNDGRSERHVSTWTIADAWLGK